MALRSLPVHNRYVEPFPFSLAVLCLSCQAVSASKTDVCPACGYKGLMNLQRAFEGLFHTHNYSTDNGFEVTDDGFLLLYCSCKDAPLKIQRK